METSTEPIKFSCIAAVDQQDGVLSRENENPWFHTVTGRTNYGRFYDRAMNDGHVIIMGLHTYETQPTDVDATVIVVTANNSGRVSRHYNAILSVPPFDHWIRHETARGVIFPTTKFSVEPEFEQSFEDALTRAHQCVSNDKQIFVVGGNRLFKEAFEHPGCERIYVNRHGSEVGWTTTISLPVNKPTPDV